MRLRKPTKASPLRHNEEKDLPRQRLAAIAFDHKGTSHKDAERIWKEAKRNANYADVVTGWAGVVT